MTLLYLYVCHLNNNLSFEPIYGTHKMLNMSLIRFPCLRFLYNEYITQYGRYLHEIEWTCFQEYILV